MDLWVDVTGDVELDQAIQELVDDGGKKAINQALRRACKEAVVEIVKPEVLARIPFRYGTLESNVTVRAVKRSKFKVGYTIGFKDPLFRGETFYGGFIEFGWDHYKGVTVQADSFLRASLYPNANKIVARVTERMRAWVEAANSSEA
ncbi:MAG: HK97 gp10 family phage protein [Pirellulales bacterium]|nr:HK97 gp10 family phage protein [Pirellulales bacterium]